MPVFFDGRLLITPQSASVVDDSAMGNRNLAVGNIVLLIGKAAGGAPKTLMRFGAPTEATAVLRSGDLLDGVKVAFDPSAQTNGPTVVYALRVDPALPSTVSLLSTGADPAASLKLTSRDFGEYTKNIQARVEVGSEANTFRLSVRLGNQYCVSDDLATVDEAVAWANSSASPLVTGEVVGANGGEILAPLAYTNLTGGTNGESLVEDWQAAFDKAQTIDAQWFAALSGNPAVHAMSDAHMAFMSTRGRKERRAFCGTEAGLTFDEAKEAAFALNSDRTGLIFQSFYNYGPDGTLKAYPPYIFAALIAGAFAGVTPGTALTNKTVKVRGIEPEVRNPTDTDDLLPGGLFVFEVTDEGYKVVQSRSTWVVNNNYNRVEISTGAATDQVVRNVRQACDKYRGETGSPTYLGQVKSAAEAALTASEKAGFIVGDETSPAWRNVQVSLEGDVTRVTYEASPGIPQNYILSTAHIVPYAGTATSV